MATSSKSTTPGTIIQSWCSVELATELRRHAADAGLSISAVVREAVAERLHQAEKHDREETHAN